MACNDEVGMGRLWVSAPLPVSIENGRTSQPVNEIGKAAAPKHQQDAGNELGTGRRDAREVLGVEAKGQSVGELAVDGKVDSQFGEPVDRIEHGERDEVKAKRRKSDLLEDQHVDALATRSHDLV